MSDEPRNPSSPNLYVTISCSLFILVALVAVLWPIFARSHRPHGGMSCLSNLKQIGIGINMYLNDYNGKLPWADFGYTPTSNPAKPTSNPDSKLDSGTALLVPTAKLDQLLVSYVKNSKIFTCPATCGGFVYNSFSKAPPDGQASRWIAGSRAKNCPDITIAPIMWDSKPDPNTQAHDDSLNVLYMDYHASSRSERRTSEYWETNSFDGWYKQAQTK